MHTLSGMNVVAKKDEVLDKLRKNRETHKQIVAEARLGYMDKAREALRKRLDELESGKLVSLVFKLQPPKDHSDAYDTAIQMLELHIGDDVELTSDQVRTLVMNEWDWHKAFVLANAGYSGTAQQLAEDKGW